MAQPKCSVVIPYRQRLDNLRAVLTSLAEQTADPTGFEVVIGAIEYDPGFLALCREFLDRLRIVSVLTDGDWNTGRARNLGIRQALGEVVVVLDADVLLAPHVLETLYDSYFQHGQQHCVLGQVFGYDEVVDRDQADVEHRPYPHFRAVLADLAALPAAERDRLDPRWSAESAPAFARFPWAFARTGLMALPTRSIREHDLLLDEDFPGWGPEDQEWAFRITRAGLPLVLGRNVYGLHLPHPRDHAAQDREAVLSNRHYLAKWPRLDLEAALAFGGWLAADRLLPEIERTLAEAAGGARLGVVGGACADGSTLLAVGARLDESGVRACEPELDPLFPPRAPLEVLPLAGFALPHPDQSFDICRLLAPVDALGARYREAVRREAERIARKVEIIPGGAR